MQLANEASFSQIQIEENTIVYRIHLDSQEFIVYSIQKQALQKIDQINNDSTICFGSIQQQMQMRMCLGVESCGNDKKLIVQGNCKSFSMPLQTIRTIISEQASRFLLSLTIKDSNNQICCSPQFLQSMDLPLLYHLSLDTTFTSLKAIRKAKFSSLMKLEIAVQRIGCQSLSQLNAPLLDQLTLIDQSDMRQYQNKYHVNTQVLFKMETQHLQKYYTNNRYQNLTNLLIEQFSGVRKQAKINKFVQKYMNFDGFDQI